MKRLVFIGILALALLCLAGVAGADGEQARWGVADNGGEPTAWVGKGSLVQAVEYANKRAGFSGDDTAYIQILTNVEGADNFPGGSSATKPFTFDSGLKTILDLNGSTIDFNGWEDSPGVSVMGGVNFTLNDTSAANSGKLTGAKNCAVAVHGGTFTMNGGNITGNSATKGGGGVVVNSGTFIMSGGTISGNTANSLGGGVYVSDLGTFEISGAPVVKNNTGENVYLPSGKTITVKGALTGGAYIGVTGADTPTSTNLIVIATGKDGYTITNAAATKFFADNRSYAAILDGGAIKLIPENCQAKWVRSDSATAPADGWTPSTLAAAVDAANATTGSGITTHIQLLSNVRTNAALTFANASNPVFLDLNGYTIDRGLDGSDAQQNGNVITVSTGTVTVKDGKITGGSTTGNGGGVRVDSGSLTLDGGAITGNAATDNGGGVYCNGTFNLSGGTISGNSAKLLGGGVYLDVKCTFNISGGTISDNTADNLGGGVYLDSDCTFNMSGGTISDNTAGYGGGVYCFSSETIIYLSGTPVIRNNTGGNVYLSNGQTINKIDALISGAQIGVTTQGNPTPESPIPVTSRYRADYSAYFTSDNSAYVARDVADDSTHKVMLFVKSADAALSKLSYSLDGGVTFTQLPNFSSDMTAYDVTLPNGTSRTAEMTLGYELSNEYATAVNQGVTLLDGKGTATVTVTAEDGKATKEYTVNFTVHHYIPPTTYTVAYLPGTLGMGAERTVYKIKSVSLTLSGAIFTREGYDQVGWATGDAGPKVYELGDTYKDDADIRLYPVWELKTYTVTYLPGAYGAGGAQTASKTHDEDVTLAEALFERKNYAQVGWAMTDGGETAYELGAEYAANADVTLYPVWALKEYQLTVTGGSGSGVYAGGERVPIAADEAGEGKRFARWEIASGGGSFVDEREAQGSFIMPEGDASISATYEEISVTLERIQMPQRREMTVGETASLPIELLPQGANQMRVRWSSDDDAVARVDARGKVTARTPGTATVTVTSAEVEGVSAICVITVKAKDEPIKPTAPIKTLTIGVDRKTDIAALFDGAYTWRSDDKKIAKITGDGMLKGVKKGNTKVRGTLGGSSGAQAKAAVLGDEMVIDVSVVAKDRAVKKVSLTPGDMTLPMGGAQTLTVNFAPENPKDPHIVWLTSDTKICVVDEKGTVTATGAGKATVTAIASSGVTATASVTVGGEGAPAAEIPAVEIALSPSVRTQEVGEKIGLDLIVTPMGAKVGAVTWQSEHPEVATVTSQGVVKALSAGETTITATSDTGLTASCTVRV